MQYRIISSPDIWDEFLSFWQSKTWATILRESSQAREVFYFWDPGTTFLLLEIRLIWLWCFGAFALWVSPVQVAHDWDIFLLALRGFLTKRWILFLQIEPLEEIPLFGCTEMEIYKKFLTPHTRIIDLSLSEDQILAQMHEKGRYNIRLATKRGVTVEPVPPTPENIDTWIKLLHETLARDGFSGNSRHYYEVFIRNITDTDRWWLYFARFEGRVIAAGIFVFTPSRAIYYYGASSSHSDDRKQMAPYLIQWYAIMEARRRGIFLYDFLGVADPRDPDDSLRGVTDFKEKYGGSLVTLPPKMLFSLSWKYPWFLRLQNIKNLLKRR